MDSDINKKAMELPEFTRREVHCCLCGAEGFDIALTDGRVPTIKGKINHRV